MLKFEGIQVLLNHSSAERQKEKRRERKKQERERERVPTIFDQGKREAYKG